MIFSKKVLTISLIVIVIVVLAIFLFNKRDGDSSAVDSSKNSSQKNPKPEETPLSVKVAKASLGDLIIKLKSPGEAVTDRKIVIKAEVEGVVNKINVRESQHVKKGDLLIELDDKKYMLEVDSAEASRLSKLSELLLEKKFSGAENASVDYDRKKISKIIEQFENTKELYQKGLISREKFEGAKKEYEMVLIESGEKKDEIMAAVKGLTQAEVNVKKAQMNLQKTKILAPFQGIICDIQVSTGEHVTSGRELFTLVDISRINVYARVLESEIGKMKVGREVDLKFSAYPGKVFKGRVKAISPIVNAEDKTCKVIIDVANPEEEIKPGMHAEVEIAAEIYENRLLIPQEAVLVRSGRKLVFVYDDGLAKWRYIETGLENEDYAEVLDNVKEGELVLVDGHFTLSHDARVRIEK